MKSSKPGLSRQRSIVFLDGRGWNVTNLCLPESEQAAPSHRLSHERESRRRRARNDFGTIYPSASTLPQVPSAEGVFHRSRPVRRRNTWTPNRLGDASNNGMSNRYGLSSGYGNEDSHRPRSRPYHHSRSFDDWNDPVEPEPEPEPQQHSTQRFDRRMIEVSPGHYAALRGSEETWNALQRNFVTTVQCPFCAIQVQCIQDAAMVLCPDCKMISPLSDDGDGLGLGIKVARVKSPPQTPHEIDQKTKAMPNVDYSGFNQNRKKEHHQIDYSGVNQNRKQEHHQIDYSGFTGSRPKKERSRIDYSNVTTHRDGYKSDEHISRVDPQAFAMPRYMRKYG